MKLTIEQALQRGVAAHKEGALQEAERFYRAILKSQPEHPDANHNLGVLAVSTNNVSAALPLFECALNSNLKTEQYWFSYIDALIQDNKHIDAKRVIQRAEQQGVDQEKLVRLKARAVTNSPAEDSNPAPHVRRSSPSSEELRVLLAHFQNGRYGDAEHIIVNRLLLMA